MARLLALLTRASCSPLARFLASLRYRNMPFFAKLTNRLSKSGLQVAVYSLPRAYYSFRSRRRL